MAPPRARAVATIGMPWMRQIARNEALRLLERRRRRNEFELLDDETLLAGVADQEALEEQEGMLLRMEVQQVDRRAERCRPTACLHYAMSAI